MKAIELETMINQSGTLQIPLDYQQYYGKSAKIIVLFPNLEEETVVKFNAIKLAIFIR